MEQPQPLSQVRQVSSSGLEVKGLRKSYRKRVVIRDVSMSLQQGEVVALLGPNGSGKTTTFYAVAGLINVKTKTKLREEAEKLNFMPKTSKLPI